MQCLPHGTRLSDHLQPVVCTVDLNDIRLCQANRARVARPSLPRASDAIHPVLGKGVVWFTRLEQRLHVCKTTFMNLISALTLNPRS